MTEVTERVITSLQNVGTAAWFGGITFGSMALSPAVRVVDDQAERGELMKTAWRNYSPVSWGGLSLLVATSVYSWMQPTRRLSRSEAKIARIRDGFIMGALAATTTSAILGNVIARQTPDERTPIETGKKPAGQTPGPARRAQRIMRFVTATNLVCGAGIIVCSTLLSESHHSARGWFR